MYPSFIIFYSNTVCSKVGVVVDPILSAYVFELPLFLPAIANVPPENCAPISVLVYNSCLTVLSGLLRGLKDLDVFLQTICMKLLYEFLYSVLTTNYVGGSANPYKLLHCCGLY
jgi:hypothetical protein